LLACRSIRARQRLWPRSSPVVVLHPLGKKCAPGWTSASRSPCTYAGPLRRTSSQASYQTIFPPHSAISESCAPSSSSNMASQPQPSIVVPPRREDAQPVGTAVQGASHPDCEVEEVCAGATAGAFRGRADAQGAERRRRQRRALRRDWAAEGGTGLAQKKGRHARLRRCVRWWSGATRRSVCGGHASCWALKPFIRSRS